MVITGQKVVNFILIINILIQPIYMIYLLLSANSDKLILPLLFLSSSVILLISLNNRPKNKKEG